jgi:hypothetical protein
VDQVLEPVGLRHLLAVGLVPRPSSRAGRGSCSRQLRELRHRAVGRKGDSRRRPPQPRSRLQPVSSTAGAGVGADTCGLDGISETAVCGTTLWAHRRGLRNSTRLHQSIAFLVGSRTPPCYAVALTNDARRAIRQSYADALTTDHTGPSSLASPGSGGTSTSGRFVRDPVKRASLKALPRHPRVEPVDRGPMAAATTICPLAGASGCPPVATLLHTICREMPEPEREALCGCPRRPSTARYPRRKSDIASGTTDASATGASRMAQPARNGAVSHAEVGHRVATGKAWLTAAPSRC